MEVEVYSLFIFRIEKLTLLMSVHEKQNKINRSLKTKLIEPTSTRSLFQLKKKTKRAINFYFHKGSSITIKILDNF